MPESKAKWLPGLSKDQDPVQQEVRRLNGQLQEERRKHHQNAFQKAAQEAGINMETIFQEAAQRRKVETRLVKEHIERISSRSRAELVKHKNEVEEARRRYLAPRREVYYKLHGNPTLAMETPVIGSEYFTTDLYESGMSGGSRPDDLPRAGARARFEIDPTHPQENRIRFHVEVDNRDSQHVHTHAEIVMGMDFEHEPPEGRWFQVQQIWLPVWGYGLYHWNGGEPTCSDSIDESMMLHSCGTAGRVDLEVYMLLEQDVPGATEVISLPRQTYRLYDFAGDPICHGVANPFGNHWGAGMIRLNDAFSSIHNTDILLRGRAERGGTIRVRVALRCRVEAYYEGEDHSVAFEDEGYLQIFFAKLIGRTVER